MDAPVPPPFFQGALPGSAGTRGAEGEPGKAPSQNLGTSSPVNGEGQPGNLTPPAPAWGGSVPRPLADPRGEFAPLRHRVRQARLVAWTEVEVFADVDRGVIMPAAVARLASGPSRMEERVGGGPPVCRRRRRMDQWWRRSAASRSSTRGSSTGPPRASQRQGRRRQSAALRIDRRFFRRFDPVESGLDENRRGRPNGWRTACARGAASSSSLMHRPRRHVSPWRAKCGAKGPRRRL